jgi:hypothetical protein
MIPRYHVYNIASGASLGIFPGADPHTALQAMLDDAGCIDGASYDLRAELVNLDRAREICNAADDGGVLPAAAAVRLFPGQPLRHTDQTIRQAWGDEWPGIDTDALSSLLWG